MSFLEQILEADLNRVGISGWEREYRFHPPRKWRLDFAWPAELVAIEVDGGTWVQGRHNRGSSIEKEFEKFNTAVCDGWRVIHCTSDMVQRGAVVPLLRALIDAAPGSEDAGGRVSHI